MNSIKEARQRIHDAIAKQKFMLYVWAEEKLNLKEWRSLEVWDALKIYLFTKHSVSFSEFDSLGVDQLKMILAGEMSSWTLPEHHRHISGNTSIEPKTAAQVFLHSCLLDAKMNAAAEEFGDWVGKENAFGVNGRDALELLLCRERGFRPGEVSNWSMDTIRKVVGPEFNSWMERQGSRGL